MLYLIQQLSYYIKMHVFFGMWTVIQAARPLRHKRPQLLRPVLLGVSLELHLHLMNCHISIFDDVARFLRRERRSEFHGDETLLARIPTL